MESARFRAHVVLARGRFVDRNCVPLPDGHWQVQLPSRPAPPPARNSANLPLVEARRSWRNPTPQSTCRAMYGHLRRMVERPIERGMMTLQQLRRFAHRCAFADETLSERDLVRSELGLTPELHAARHGCRAAGTGTLVDQLALELRDAGEHGEHHASRRRGRVGPGLGERAQPRSRLVQLLGDVEQVARRPR